MGKKTVLVLGASGMLGSAMISVLSESEDLYVIGTARNIVQVGSFKPLVMSDIQHVPTALDVFRPDIVINCIGLIKQRPECSDPNLAIEINSLFPHKLADQCYAVGARLIHISTDCVFSGKRGWYREDDRCDAEDLYGLTKIHGEVDYPNAITLRTSIIGHELKLPSYGLLEWFLSQKDRCSGFTEAVFTGLPTVELARVIRDFVIPKPNLHGIYHVASKPITKYELLKVIAFYYNKSIQIDKDDRPMPDRSLDGTKFRMATGYVAPDWPDLIKLMHKYQ